MFRKVTPNAFLCSPPSRVPPGSRPFSSPPRSSVALPAVAGAKGMFCPAPLRLNLFSRVNCCFWPESFIPSSGSLDLRGVLLVFVGVSCPFPFSILLFSSTSLRRIFLSVLAKFLSPPAAALERRRADDMEKCDAPDWAVDLGAVGTWFS